MSPDAGDGDDDAAGGDAAAGGLAADDAAAGLLLLAGAPATTWATTARACPPRGCSACLGSPVMPASRRGEHSAAQEAKRVELVWCLVIRVVMGLRIRDDSSFVELKLRLLNISSCFNLLGRKKAESL